MSLEDISLMFKKQKTLEFSKEKIKELIPHKKNEPVASATNGNNANDTERPRTATSSVRGQEIEMTSRTPVETPSPSGAEKGT